jgi:hypothetical protein
VIIKKSSFENRQSSSGVPSGQLVEEGVENSGVEC